MPIDRQGRHSAINAGIVFNNDIGVAIIGNFESSAAGQIGCDRGNGGSCIINRPADTLNENHKNTMIALSLYLVETYNLRSIISVPDAQNRPRLNAPVAVHYDVTVGFQTCPGDGARPWIVGELRQNINNWLENS